MLKLAVKNILNRLKYGMTNERYEYTILKDLTLFSRKQLRVICDVHELLIKQLALRLEQELHITGDFHIAMVDQLTYDEFLRSTASPTALAELEIRLPSLVKDLVPAESYIFIEMNTELARDFIKKNSWKIK